MRFTGTIEAKADAKGRVFFPAMFRKVLASAGEEQLFSLALCCIPGVFGTNNSIVYALV